MPSDKKLPLVVIIGPTAVGKTELSLRLAEKINGEIVSADSRLFYRGMDIGTAKPSEDELKRVPHHLIDVADPNENWSLAKFQKAARDAVSRIQQLGRLPLLVGGTGQYITAVTRGWQPPQVKPNPKLRQTLENIAENTDPFWLHAKLAILDPTAAEKIDPRNLRRVIRALEVILLTGQPFSVQRGQADESPYNLLTIGLTRPRPELYARVDERIEIMFANGLLDEVRTLLEKGYAPDLPSMSAIGYRQCVAVLKAEMTLDEAKIQMKRQTRVFVRRQANWFKQDDPEINWFYAGDEHLISKVANLVQLTFST